MCELKNWGSETQKVTTNTLLVPNVCRTFSKDWGKNHILQESVCLRSSAIPDVSNIWQLPLCVPTSATFKFHSDIRPSSFMVKRNINYIELFQPVHRGNNKRL
jgi:hypothetical protein